jgi:NTP pyrophosphatase (non-canonical NTP hydrolase)
LDKLDKKEIEGEFADVVLTTFMLARRFDIDIGSALKDKISKIQGRNYNE